MTETAKRPLYVPHAGPSLLEMPLLNKGSAFSTQERIDFNLQGLLPHNIETIEEQTERAYSQYNLCNTDLDRHIFLRSIDPLGDLRPGGDRAVHHRQGQGGGELRHAPRASGLRTGAALGARTPRAGGRRCPRRDRSLVPTCRAIACARPWSYWAGRRKRKPRSGRRSATPFPADRLSSTVDDEARPVAGLVFWGGEVSDCSSGKIF